jgi:hypothetical protein
VILLIAGRGGGTLSACLETSWAGFAGACSTVGPTWAQASAAATQREAVMVRPQVSCRRRSDEARGYRSTHDDHYQLDESIWNQVTASVRFAKTSWQYAWSVASLQARLVGTRRHKLLQDIHIHEQSHLRHARCIMMTPSPHGPALPGSTSAKETERSEGDEASSMNIKVFVLLMATAGAVGLVECGCPAGLFPVSGKVL